MLLGKKEKYPAQATTSISRSGRLFFTAMERVSETALPGEPRFELYYLYSANDLLCRLDYISEQDDWDFAIYRANFGAYSFGDYLLPKQASPEGYIHKSLLFFTTYRGLCG